jgi:uncharacterized oxidoreductase
LVAKAPPPGGAERPVHTPHCAKCRDTTVRVLEIAPPWVRTELMNSQEAEQAMPLEQFIEETIAVLRTDADEILVDAAKPLRANVGPKEHGLVNSFNAQMTAVFAGG